MRTFLVDISVLPAPDWDANTLTAVPKKKSSLFSKNRPEERIVFLTSVGSRRSRISSTDFMSDLFVVQITLVDPLCQRRLNREEIKTSRLAYVITEEKKQKVYVSKKQLDHCPSSVGMDLVIHKPSGYKSAGLLHSCHEMSDLKYGFLKNAYDQFEALQEENDKSEAELLTNTQKLEKDI